MPRLTREHAGWALAAIIAGLWACAGVLMTGGDDALPLSAWEVRR